MARALSISPSGQQPIKQKWAQKVRDEKVRHIFEDSKERDARHKNHRQQHRAIERQGLVARAGRQFNVTTDSKHTLPVAPNLLEQNFTADKPNQKWAGDITDLMTSEGWLYLAAIINLYARSMIGGSMSNRMASTRVCDALQIALWRRSKPKNVIVHSSQYCSHAYRDLIKKNGLIESMNRKATTRTMPVLKAPSTQ